jgi:hypothetical protein
MPAMLWRGGRDQNEDRCAVSSLGDHRRHARAVQEAEIVPGQQPVLVADAEAELLVQQRRDAAAKLPVVLPAASSLKKLTPQRCSAETAAATTIRLSSYSLRPGA